MKNLKNRYYLLMGAAAIVASQAYAVGTAPVEISGTVDDLTTGFGLIKTLVMTVVVFGIVVGYVKLAKKK